MNTVDFSFVAPLLAGAGLTLLAQRLHQWLLDRWELGAWTEACEVYERRRQVPVNVVRRGVYDYEGEL